jgi:hypothetical protein
MMQKASFRCFESGCFWQGKGFDSAKAHWMGCELNQAREAAAAAVGVIAKLAEDLAKVSMENNELHEELRVARRGRAAMTSMRMVMRVALDRMHAVLAESEPEVKPHGALAPEKHGRSASREEPANAPGAKRLRPRRASPAPAGEVLTGAASEFGSSAAAATI